MAELSAALEAEFSRLGVDPARKPASAPTGTANAVIDLHAEVIDADGEGGEPANGLRLSWTERLVGDYDQNGQVLASDLSALGLNFNRSVSYAPAAEHNGIAVMPMGDPLHGAGENWRLARVDGDGNGVIAIGDLTAIGVHFRERVDGYRVYRRGPGEAQFTLLGNPADGGSQPTVPRGLASAGSPTSPVRYTFDDLLSAEGDYEYQVAAYDSSTGTEGPRNVISIGSGGQPGGDFFACGFSFGPAPDPDPPVFSDVLLIRNDADVYNTNYNALTNDLDAIPVDYEEIDYYDGVDDYFINGDYTTAIWFRGGPSGMTASEAAQSAAWTDAEIENYLNIMLGDGDMLLMSQNHGIADYSFIGPSQDNDAFDELPAFTVVAPAATFAQQSLGWSAGLGTDNGVGYGETHGYMHSAPNSAIGAFETEALADGAKGAERYTGEKSSGMVPLSISLPTSQFCNVAFYGAFSLSSGLAAPSFTAGLGFDAYTGMEFEHSYGAYPDERMVFNYVSYGNTRAPGENIGSYPAYNHSQQGNAHLWVIGYSWNDVTVSSPGNTMQRHDMLHNVLAWLTN